jgi:hypothetical protein
MRERSQKKKAEEEVTPAAKKKASEKMKIYTRKCRQKMKDEREANPDDEDDEEILIKIKRLKID